jgi:mannose-1-phosphate guanylyltransferase
MKWAVILTGRSSRDDLHIRFGPLVGGRTPLGQIRRLAAQHVEPDHLFCVVDRANEERCRAELKGTQVPNFIEQPVDRGRAAAIAYSVACVARYDTKGVVGVFPADHYYDDVDAFHWIVEETYEIAARFPSYVFFLGSEAQGPEVEYGWIEPGARLDACSLAFGVKQFWERPAAEMARSLFARNCLLNMFVMIGCVDAFRRLMYSAVPEMIRVVETAVDRGSGRANAIARAYESLPTVDLSNHVLMRHTDLAAVVRVPRMSWTDLRHLRSTTGSMAQQQRTIDLAS